MEDPGRSLCPTEFDGWLGRFLRSPVASPASKSLRPCSGRLKKSRIILTTFREKADLSDVGFKKASSVVPWDLKKLLEGKF